MLLVLMMRVSLRVLGDSDNLAVLLVFMMRVSLCVLGELGKIGGAVSFYVDGSDVRYGDFDNMADLN